MLPVKKAFECLHQESVHIYIYVDICMYVDDIIIYFFRLNLMYQTERMFI